ncbi:MAG TPA: flavin reductase family protein [Tepidisphaeraceae bacterium]|jgi:flavin reductase (DIM6/NTAB) family NADH-FMN oxidoreductase RutF
MTDQQKHAIGRALGRVPSGVFILTAKHNDQTSAMLASWVQQAGFEPPTVSVAIAKGRPIADFIRSSRRLALSIVANDDKGLMKHYARLKAGDDPFAGMRTEPSPSGLPVLTDALAWLDCRVIETCDFGGDHELFIAQITDGSMPRDGVAFCHQRGNGFHY